jgi:hypothetical protein
VKPGNFFKIRFVFLLEDCGGPTTRGKTRRESEISAFPGLLIDTATLRSFSRATFSTGCGPAA